MPGGWAQQMQIPLNQMPAAPGCNLSSTIKGIVMNEGAGIV